MGKGLSTGSFWSCAWSVDECGRIPDSAKKLKSTTRMFAVMMEGSGDLENCLLYFSLGGNRQRALWRRCTWKGWSWLQVLLMSWTCPVTPFFAVTTDHRSLSRDSHGLSSSAWLLLLLSLQKQPGGSMKWTNATRFLLVLRSGLLAVTTLAWVWIHPASLNCFFSFFTPCCSPSVLVPALTRASFLLLRSGNVQFSLTRSLHAWLFLVWASIPWGHFLTNLLKQHLLPNLVNLPCAAQSTSSFYSFLVK